MNYGKKNAAKIKWQLTSRGTVMRRKVKSLTLLIILLCFVLVLGYGGYRGYQYVEQIIAEAPDINEIDATPSGYMSTVLDAKGNVTAQLVGTGSNRVYVTLDEIPEELQKAFVAIEDERFYDHNGIDLRGIVRAGIKGVTTGHFSEGASTITQQLLKNNVFDGWTTENYSGTISGITAGKKGFQRLDHGELSEYHQSGTEYAGCPGGLQTLFWQGCIRTQSL